MVAGPPAIRRELLHQTVQDRIKQFILERGFRAGDLLPAEAELARALGVSRPSLREAMRALQILGVIETRHGAGTFVGHFSLDPLVASLTFRILMDRSRTVQTVRELLEIRLVLESALVQRIAASPTPEQVVELRELLARMEDRAARNESFPEEDRAFHEALYRPLANRMVASLLQAFWDVIALVRHELGFEFVPPAATAADHRRILEAIEAGDATAAASAMVDHFHGIQQRLPEPGGAVVSDASVEG
ncbi:MAG: FadR/GntR family transcriptional regulator [Thermomicrobiales bacterium]